ncbi:hypothetical protein PhCBS80983_g04715 [Powellomyces hirtus]|uniref:Rho-GAP domain-containing protein n=1 Tax=Powellomyces hirtus TaxID=109895 RepID=A0A507DXK5_9FUNG|nr:hypothetical protein PhCBS80983_g04715 [Powellomyces hirtus]
MRPISPPTTASSGSMSSSKRVPRDYAPSRSMSRMTVRERGDEEYTDRAAPAVENVYANPQSRRTSIAPGYADARQQPEDDPAAEDTMCDLRDPEEADEHNERVIQNLCDFESGFHLLLDRIKQDVHSTKEAVTFLRKRAQIEEEYGKSMVKLCQSCSHTTTSSSNNNIATNVGNNGATGKSEAKGGSFGQSWTQFTGVHEQVGEIRVKFAAECVELAEELATLHKNTDRSRKQLKEAGHRHFKTVQEAEAALEKAKIRYENTSEEWERAMLHREQQAERDGFGRYNAGPGGMGMGMGAGGSGGLAGMQKSMSTKSLTAKTLTNPMARWKSQTPAKLQKAEEDARSKAAHANAAYKQQLYQTTAIRHDYTHTHLPRFIRLLKTTNDECDQGLQYHLNAYAQSLGAAMTQEALLVSPLNPDNNGLVQVLERIDDARDFDDFVVEYKRTVERQKGDPYAMTDPASLAPAKPSFGISLDELMERDQAPVPHIVTKCIAFVERHGLTTQGIYRVSGPTVQVQKLRAVLDRDAENADLDGLAPDIHSVCGVFKLYFRELPDPLFPRRMYRQLLEAARIEDPHLRLTTTHELINGLPDANYATLQALAAHLHRITQHEHMTCMSAQNLSIIWGPTLLDAPTSPDATPDPADIKLQTRIVELAIANYFVIFDPEE